jgi:cephalosporin hydroxylase
MKRFTLLQLLLCCALSAAAVGGLIQLLQTAQCQAAVQRTLTLLGFGNESQGDPYDADLQQAARAAYDELLVRRSREIPPDEQRQLMLLYHRLGLWQSMWWLGVPVQKNPCDLWMMQQTILETRPDFIVEAGTFRGGSALYFATILSGVGLDSSKVLTIDIGHGCQQAARNPLWQKHVEFILGSSTDPATVARVRDRVAGKKVLVVLDSVHTRSHVAEELRCYAGLVSPGSYLVVEDTNIDGVPVMPEAGPGPMAAVREFLASPQGKAFEQDLTREALVLTFNPGGWLKRRANAE